MSRRQRSIPFARARQLFLLLGELRELGANTDAVRAHLARGLLRLVPAQLVLVGRIEAREAHGTGILRSVAEAGWGPSERALAFAFYEEKGLAADPLANVLGQQSESGVVTARPLDLLAKRDWYESAFFNDCRRPSGVDDAIYSQRIGRARTEAIGLTRAANDRPFTEVDRDVMHLAHLALVDVLEQVALECHEPRLAPRARATLEPLMRGLSDKEIAAELGVGRNTVNKYVMSILRAYGVRSRAQLMSRLLKRG